VQRLTAILYTGNDFRYGIYSCGYWHLFDKTTFHFIAAAFLPHHITTVVINYPFAAAAMDEIVASCRKAVRWLQQHPSAFNPDPQQVYIAGHSAGAHLAAMLMSKQWLLTCSLLLKGCVCSAACII
jgi:acetyl esterase/lipase